jgi:hypothetical protein
MQHDGACIRSWAVESGQLLLLLLLVLNCRAAAAAVLAAPTIDASPGNIMENTPISRIRRQMSCVYWEP